MPYHRGVVNADAQRARTTFFVCLVAGIFDLIALDFWIGPTALASPHAMPTAAPSTSSGAAPRPAAPPSPAASPGAAKPAPVVVMTDAGNGRISGVVARFEFESANADLTLLRLLAKQMNEDPTSEVILEGHADPSGNEYRNLSLSLDRAIWAKERLVEFGVPPQRIKTVGLGSARPLAENVEDAGSINRRVEARWVTKSSNGGGQ
jgi:outer membrane protein OmpA-like peptidoglycan-associated protein